MEGSHEKMSEQWYRVGSDERLTQGDIIFRCPLLNWNAEALQVTSPASGAEEIQRLVRPFETDVVVLSQACDLEQDHVENVVLCSHVPLAEHKTHWEESEKARGQNPTAKSWKIHCNDIKDGYVWNLCFIRLDETVSGLEDNRVVEFREIFTAPRVMLESLIRERGEKSATCPTLSGPPLPSVRTILHEGRSSDAGSANLAVVTPGPNISAFCGQLELMRQSRNKKGFSAHHERSEIRSY